MCVCMCVRALWLELGPCGTFSELSKLKVGCTGEGGAGSRATPLVLSHNRRVGSEASRSDNFMMKVAQMGGFRAVTLDLPPGKYPYQLPRVLSQPHSLTRKKEIKCVSATLKLSFFPILLRPNAEGREQWVYRRHARPPRLPSS